MLRFINEFRNSYEGKVYKYALFILFFWLILGYFHLNSDLGQMFYGPHYWRQADGLAQTMNYVKNGYNFFDHSLYYNQFNGSSKGVGEFPIMYYWIALQKGAFGGDLFYLFRLNNFILGFFGCLSIFKISFHFLKNAVLSIAITFLVFGSAVFSIYYLAPMPDPLAFNLSMIGYWWVLQYYHKRRPRYLIGAVFMLSVAFMVKFYFIIPFLAFLILLLLKKLVKIQPHSNLKFHPFLLLPIFSGVGWLVYMKLFNQTESCNCFLGETMPIWRSTPGQLERTLNNITALRYDYMSKYVLILFCSSVLINMFWWKKQFQLMNWFLIISLIGAASFVLVFFQMFEGHDYYIYPIIFLVPLSIGILCFKVNTILESSYGLQRLSLISICIVLLCIQNALPTFEKRRWDKNMNHQDYYSNFNNSDLLLDELGVNRNSKIISLSDVTPNYSLILMDRKGWSAYQAYYLKWTMDDFVSKGADYLVLNDKLQLWNADAHASGFLDYPIADENDLMVYDLRPYSE